MLYRIQNAVSTKDGELFPDAKNVRDSRKINSGRRCVF